MLSLHVLLRDRRQSSCESHEQSRTPPANEGFYAGKRMSRMKAGNTWQHLPAETEAKAAASRRVVLRLKIIILHSVNVCDEKALVQWTYIDIHVHRSCLTSS